MSNIFVFLFLVSSVSSVTTNFNSAPGNVAFFGSSSAEDLPAGVYVDQVNNVRYILGQVNGDTNGDSALKASFHNAPDAPFVSNKYSAGFESSVSLSHPAGYENVLLMKVDETTNKVVWWTVFGSLDTEYPIGIAGDSHGNVYITGITYDDWDDSQYYDAGTNSQGIFLIQFDKDGKLLRFYQTPMGDIYSAGALVVAQDDTVYITGTNKFNQLWVAALAPSHTKTDSFEIEYEQAFGALGSYSGIHGTSIGLYDQQTLIIGAKSSDPAPPVTRTKATGSTHSYKGGAALLMRMNIGAGQLTNDWSELIVNYDSDAEKIKRDNYVGSVAFDKSSDSIFFTLQEDIKHGYSYLFKYNEKTGDFQSVQSKATTWTVAQGNSDFPLVALSTAGADPIKDKEDVEHQPPCKQTAYVLDFSGATLHTFNNIQDTDSPFLTVLGINADVANKKINVHVVTQNTDADSVSGSTLVSPTAFVGVDWMTDSAPSDKDVVESVFTVTRTDSLTTSQMTTQEMTTQQLTTQEMTTQQMTTQEMTTQQMTTQEMTTQEMTTQQMTTQEMTTQQMTTQEMTTQEMTTQQMTTQDMTTQGMTTASMTSASMTTAAMTTGGALHSVLDSVVTMTGTQTFSDVFLSQVVIPDYSSPVNSFTYFSLQSASNKFAYKTVYVLTKPYTGNPTVLGAQTDGYFAKATTKNHLVWLFNDDVSFVAGTTYYFYISTKISVTLDVGQPSSRRSNNKPYSSYDGTTWSTSTDSLVYQLVATSDGKGMGDPFFVGFNNQMFEFDGHVSGMYNLYNDAWMNLNTEFDSGNTKNSSITIMKTLALTIGGHNITMDRSRFISWGQFSIDVDGQEMIVDQSVTHLDGCVDIQYKSMIYITSPLHNIFVYPKKGRNHHVNTAYFDIHIHHPEEDLTKIGGLLGQTANPTNTISTEEKKFEVDSLFSLGESAFFENKAFTCDAVDN